ncbi:HAD family phosphatase [Leptolyngbya iicbica LK]|uniref:HAD family phosphatase n=2 Tax=Cyanophyceae TaxID=3028117 RepID=A0A4V2E2D0_9CYAN|nr:HAD family phosphatase [Leptolyngbya sp. LK]
MRMVAPQALIFDMDGLMLNSEPLYQQAWQAAAQELGFTLETELYLSLVGRSSAEADRLFVEMYGDQFPVEVFNERWEAQWRSLVQQQGIQLQPGLLPLLDWVEQQGLPKAVGTSSLAAEAELCLGMAGIRDRFTTVVTADQVTAGKPAPDIFLAAATLLGASPADCLVLEDSNAGVQAAQAAGMSVVMVPDLQVPTATSQEIAQQIFASLHEVLTWLRGL